MEDKTLAEAITNQVNKVPFGNVSITVYRHGNKTVNYIVHEFENQVFDNNVDFMGWIIAGLKKIAQEKQSGEIILRITAKDGEFKKVTEERKIQGS